MLWKHLASMVGLSLVTTLVVGAPAQAGGDFPGEILPSPLELVAPVSGAALLGLFEVVLAPSPAAPAGTTVTLVRAALDGPSGERCSASATEPDPDQVFRLNLDTSNCPAGSRVLTYEVAWTDQAGAPHGITDNLPVEVLDTSVPTIDRSSHVDASYLAHPVVTRANPYGAMNPSRVWLTCRDQSPVTWAVHIETLDGTAARTISPASPECRGMQAAAYRGFEVSWDGSDDGGQLLPDGEYVLVAEATDEAGHVGSYQLPVYIDSRIPWSLTSPDPGEAPTIVEFVVTPTPGTTLTNGSLQFGAGRGDWCYSGAMDPVFPDGTIRKTVDTSDCVPGDGDNWISAGWLDSFDQEHSYGILNPVWVALPAAPLELVAPVSGAALSGVFEVVLAPSPAAPVGTTVTLVRAALDGPSGERCSASVTEPDPDQVFRLSLDTSNCPAGSRRLTYEVTWTDQAGAPHGITDNLPVEVLDTSVPRIDRSSYVDDGAYQIHPTVTRPTPYGAMAEIVVRLACWDQSAVTWAAHVEASDGTAVRTLSSAGQAARCGGMQAAADPRFLVRWDGSDDSGQLLADGEYLLAVEATDEAGHVGTYQLPVYIDSRIPASLTAPSPGEAPKLVEFVVTPTAGTTLTKGGLQFGAHKDECYWGAMDPVSADGTIRKTVDTSNCWPGEGEGWINVYWLDSFNQEHVYYFMHSVTVDDFDGVPRTVEEGAPNGGDGNGDRNWDSYQWYVASLPSAIPGAGYITVAGDRHLSEVRAVDPGDTANVTVAIPAEYQLSTGLTRLRVANRDVGEDVFLDIYRESLAPALGFAWFDPVTGSWTQLPADRYSLVADHVRIRLTDGGVGDTDGVADGSIDSFGGVLANPSGIPTAVEAAAPNSGDGNLDGTQDAAQANVASLPAAVDGTGYVTVASPPGTVLTGVTTIDPNTLTTQAPEGYALPSGLAKFVVEGVASDADTIVSMFVSSTAGVTGYAKYDAARGWSLMPADRVTIIDHPDLELSELQIRLTDGGVWDADGTVNGRIDDPGAPVVDIEPPSITIEGPTDQAVYTLGTAPTASCTATDGGSGVEAQGCMVTITGGNANHVGEFTVTATARDTAGNKAEKKLTYQVHYQWDGFDQPINDTAHQTGLATSVFKAGSTVPAKFTLTGPDGLPITPTVPPKWGTPVKGVARSLTVDESVYTIPPDSGVSFNDVGGRWAYNWKTSSTQSGYYWRVSVTLDDGTSHHVNIALN